MRLKITLFISSLVLSLVLVEVCLSTFYPQLSRRPQVWQFDPELGWGHIPSATGLFIGPEFEVEIQINAAGLRDRNYQRTKPHKTQRLLAFGDSFIEGWGVPIEHSVAKQLEIQLQQAAAPDTTVEVINFGVAGYGTDQEMLFFERTGKHYQPDQVLLFFYGNDLWNNAAPTGIGSERGYKPFFRPNANGRLELGRMPVPKHPFWDRNNHASRPWSLRLSSYLHEHWHLYVLARKAWPTAMPRNTHQDFYSGLYGSQQDPRWQQLWFLSGRLLEIFKNRVERTGAQLVLIYIPAIVQIEAADWKTKRTLYNLVGDFDLLSPNRRLAQLARRYAIPFIDLYPAFKQAAAQQTLYFRDSHWNTQGHALAATEIKKFLLHNTHIKQ